MHIFFLTVLKLEKATMKAFDQISSGMLWACNTSVSGGKSKVFWTEVCRSKELGAWESLIWINLCMPLGFTGFGLSGPPWTSLGWASKLHMMRWTVTSSTLLPR
jgi:hypothetical protein